jgi:hypothetical protein
MVVAVAVVLVVLPLPLPSCYHPDYGREKNCTAEGLE